MKRYNPYLLLIPLFICLGQEAYGQKLFSNNKYSLEGAAFLSATDEVPFWLRTNQYGEVPRESQFFQLKGTVFHEYDSIYSQKGEMNKFAWGYGLTGLVNVGGNTQGILSEAYVKTRLGGFELYAGRRKEIFGLVDSSMTSGSYIWSGNALPMPKVQIHTPGFVPVTKNGFLSWKGGLSHGWFGSTDSVVQGHFLHQKWLYFKLGKPDKKFHFMLGANHQVMWGGESDKLEDSPGGVSATIDGKLAPFPLYSYQYILIPFLQKISPPKAGKVPDWDGGLAVGNQLGSVDLAFDLNLPNAKFLLYLQQPFDFGRSIKNGNNIEDGLYGLSVNFKNNTFLSHITLEYFYSLSQGRYRFGQYQENNSGEVDNYFHHGQYQSWSYKDQILGSPFITNEEQEVFNNRVKYIYLGFKGSLGFLDYYTRHSWSRNYGSYVTPIDAKQYSGFLALSKAIFKQSLFSFTLAYDQGELYESNFGVHLSYTQQF